MTELAKVIKAALDKAPACDSPFEYGKQVHILIDAMLEAGYELEAHQGGITGTYLVAAPKFEDVEQTQSSFNRTC